MPDKELLLTDEERLKKLHSWASCISPDVEAEAIREWVTQLLSAQLAKDTKYYEAKIAELQTKELLPLPNEVKALIAEARKELIKEIEKNSAVEKLPYRDGGLSIRTIPEDTWQALNEG